MAKITDKLWKKPGDFSQPNLTIQISPTSSYGVPRLRQTRQGTSSRPHYLGHHHCEVRANWFRIITNGDGARGKNKGLKKSKSDSPKWQLARWISSFVVLISQFGFSSELYDIAKERTDCRSGPYYSTTVIIFDDRRRQTNFHAFRPLQTRLDGACYIMEACDK